MKRVWPAIVAATVATTAVFLTRQHGAVLGAPTGALRFVQTIPLDGVQGRIDHMAVDLKGHRLFVAALGNNTVEVVDLQSGKRVHTISGLHEPQGVAYVPTNNRLFVANGGSGTCDIFDAESLRKVDSVRLGDDVDNARYDAAHERIIVGYGNGGLAIVNARDEKLMGTVPLPGHPESFQVEANGNRAFVNVPATGDVAVTDLVSHRVDATWTVKGASANFPMALDEAHHRLFIGCRRPAHLIVLDTETGRETGHASIGEDTDDIFYDAARKRLYVSCGSGTVNVFQRDSSDRYTLLGDVATAPGARTSLFVPSVGRLYVGAPQRDGHPAQIRIYETH